jgi:mutator protein MutT
MMKTTTVLGAIIEKSGSVLLAKRKMHKAMGGKWEFPGGKLEDGESDRECLSREIMEEFSVEIEVFDFYMDSSIQHGDKIIHLKTYKTKLLSDKFMLVDHDEVAWVKPQDLIKYELSEADVAIAQSLKEQGIS